MPGEKENIDDIKKQPAKKSFLSRLFKWFAITAASIVFLLILLFIFIQTDLFDRLALDFALDKLNDSFASKQTTIHAESLTGNLLKGFTLNNASIKVKDDTLIKFNSLSAKYNILKLLGKEISVQDLTIREPQINLTKVRGRDDSLKWNLSYFLESEKEEEDTLTSEFDWTVNAENFSIENGAVRILEDKNSDLPIRDIVMQKLDSFEFGKLDVNDLNLNLKAYYSPDSKDVSINNLGFNTNSDFNIHKMTLHANINEKDTVTGINNFAVVTSRSDISINEFRMEHLNPFEGIDIEKFGPNETKLDLETRTFNFDDLTFFIPGLDFLDSTISLKLAADGTYGNLNVSDLDLKTPNSTYTFSGNLKNLDEPSKLYFDITGRNIEIDPKDTRLVLPGLSIPDYSYLGRVYIPSLTYKGEADRFSSDFDINSSAGNARGNVNLDFTQNVTKYKFDVTTRNLNIGRIIKDKSLESNINGNFSADARGFDYRTMTGKLNYTLSGTKFYGQNISRSAGHLEFNRGNVNLNLSYDSDALRTKAAGRVNISNMKNITYDVKGTVSGLNIASFTKDNSLNSSLNFDFDLNGRGIDPDNITGNFKLAMNPSTFGEYIIPATPVDMEIDQNGNIKKITMKSDLIDLDVDGSFNINDLSEVIENNIDKITYDLQNKMGSDSSGITRDVRTFTGVCRDLNMKYSLNVKDLAPLSSFTGNDTINFVGNIEGNLSDSCGLFTFYSKGDIEKFEFGDSVFITKDARFNIDIRNNVNSYKLSDFNARLDFFADNELIVSGFALDSTQARVTFFENQNKIVLWTQKDSTISLFTEAMLMDSLVVAFDSLDLRYQDVHVTNNKDLIVKYNTVDSNSSIEFRQFSVNSLNQKLTVEGIYSITDTSNVKVSANNIDLIKLITFLSDDIDTANMISGRIRYVDLIYRGTLEKPDIDLGINSELLRIGPTTIGRLDADIKYSEYLLESNTVFYNEKNTGNFSLVGSTPAIIRFAGEKLDSLQRAELLGSRTVDLNVIAKNFQLKVFQQLIPYTSNLSGILDGKISLLGTVNDPSLTGNMDITRGNLFVTLNKMRYNFYVKLATENEKLIIKDSRVYDPSETSRFISSSGYIDFTGLSINKIYVEMDGNIKAFDKDNSMTELGIAGDLWVGSGSPRLKITGNSERIDLTGNLLLIKGNVVFNPFMQEAYNLYSDDFLYGVIIDSLKNDSVKIERVMLESSDSSIVLKNKYLNPFEKILYEREHKNELKKIVKEESGKFYYNLYVTTSENVFLKFIVNEKSQQEFFGEIKTDLYIDNRDNQMSGRGEVRLGDNCYYKFFRKFDATGRVIFTGPISNPELDIDAQYKGYTTSGNNLTGTNSLDEVLINLKVTGRAANPELAISIENNGVKETGADATSNAISFLLFGKLKNQLTFDESTSLGANVGASYLSSYVSSSLEELFPFLINTNLNYVDSESGTVIQNTDIRFTAAFGDAIIRFGGQIFKGISNTDIAIDYPLTKLFKVQSLSNDLMFRVERIYDPFEGQNDITNTTGTRAGALIYYRIKF